MLERERGICILYSFIKKRHNTWLNWVLFFYGWSCFYLLLLNPERTLHLDNATLVVEVVHRGLSKSLYTVQEYLVYLWLSHYIHLLPLFKWFSVLFLPPFFFWNNFLVVFISGIIASIVGNPKTGSNGGSGMQMHLVVIVWVSPFLTTLNAPLTSP